MTQIFSVLGLLLATNAMAMPHDQPKLEFFTKDAVSVGLVYSEGNDGNSDPHVHRLLQEVYICKAGQRIYDFTQFQTFVDDTGVSILAEAQSGGSITLGHIADSILIEASTLPNLKVAEFEDPILALKESGIAGFELNWSDPCAPKKADQ